MLRSMTLLGYGLLLFLCLACKKPSEPPREVQERYFARAASFCQVIVGCMQADMRQRLADEPQRRDLVLRRMNQEVCHRNQIKQLSQLQLLGSLEADPQGPRAVQYDQELYQAYGNCTAALQAARQNSDCAAVRETYDTHPDCQRVRPSKQADQNSIQE